MATPIEQLVIVHYPDPRLRRKADPVPAVTNEVREVAAKMLDLMHQAPGVGLAAPQVGLSWRMFVANPDNLPDGDCVFINPVLTNPTPELTEAEEGCLSLPDITVNIRRPAGITIQATGIDGQTISMTADGLAARVWQHEYDHLDAVLIIDRMGPIDRLTNRRALKHLTDTAPKASGRRPPKR